MLSMNVLKPSTDPTFSPSHHHLRSKLFKPASFLSLPPPKLPSSSSSSSSSSSVRSWIRPNSTFTNRKNQRSTYSSPAEAAAPAVVSVPEQDTSSTTSPSGKQKHRVAVKAAEKARIALKFIWMEKNIGVAVDQEIPGHGTIPLSPYYFWPRKDAWDELKVLLESKPWISNKQMVLLLNQATDIINLWQQSGSQLS